MSPFLIRAFLPKDRRLPGFIELFDPHGRALLYDLPCRGKADSARAEINGNPSRDPTRPWGDLPAGTYQPAKVLHYAPRHRTFGDFAILLDGASGPALVAKQQGRTGLAIHGGRGDDRLMATYGCLRVFDRDMALLAETLGNEPLAVEVIDTDAWPPKR